MASTRVAALDLYRSILRAHRAHLPLHLRLLGDAYVREEFKRHKTASAKFVPSFLAEWAAYVNELSRQSASSGAVLGREMDSETVRSLSEDQQAQLNLLKNEAGKDYKGV